METLEEISTDKAPETPKQTSDLTYEAHQIMTKEILSTKTRSYLRKSKKSENTLNQITFSLGMGSFWRFPYLCHKNGAGSFVLVYIFMLLLVGIPLLCIEMIMAHWLQANNIQTWVQLVPSLGGIGYISMLISFFMSCCYSILITWNFFYLINSFDFPLIWEQCTPGLNKTNPDLACLQTVSPNYFWYQNVLRGTDYIETGVQVLVSHLLLLNLAIWIFTYFMMIFQNRHSVTMQIFSLFFLFFILLCLLIRGFFLGTSISGFSRLMTTKETWFSMELWRHAGGHVLYSLGLGLGAIKNPVFKPVDNNYFWMASLVALVNLFVSLLASGITFIILEFWITNSGQACLSNSVANLKQLISRHLLPENALPPKSVLQGPPMGYIEWVRSLRWPLQNQVVLSAPSCSVKTLPNKFLDSPGLALVTFSQAISLMKASNFWAILFFLSQLILGLNCMKRIIECITVPLQSSFSITLQYRHAFAVIMCLSGFLGSMFYASQSGSFIFQLFDDYLIPLCLILIVLFQTVTLVCIYGVHRVRERLFYEIGLMLWPFFTCLWSYVVLPMLLLLVILSFTALGQTPLYTLWNNTLSDEVEQPYPLRTWGWLLNVFFMIFLPMPIYLCYQYAMPSSADTGNTQEQWSKMPSVMLHKPMLPKISRDESAIHSLGNTQQISQRSLWRSRRNNSWTFRGGSFVKGTPNLLDLPRTMAHGSGSYGSLSQTQSGHVSASDTPSSNIASEELSRDSLPRDQGSGTADRMILRSHLEAVAS
ncbi:orphan sodium- and chloride-dependent neurotransmitter transporter NTT5-like [Sorex fumeus]|uniref:orphan sodium- and chloride-dependent neurotransmitter transporter NTT5-like n=1 Tax=Sorex fumeus TaxID=62283 RepID=UPI0024AC8E7E|nr:orphan sodium- and chloride-dependent neurotransmitter transporter NTT5-like [Sorex fumeus]